MHESGLFVWRVLVRRRALLRGKTEGWTSDSDAGGRGLSYVAGNESSPDAEGDRNRWEMKDRHTESFADWTEEEVGS